MIGTPISGTKLGTIWTLSNYFYRDQVNEPKSAEARDSALDVVNQPLSMSQKAGQTIV